MSDLFHEDVPFDSQRLIELARLGLAKLPPADSIQVKIAVAATADRDISVQSCGEDEQDAESLQDLLTWCEGAVTHAAIVTAYIPRIQVNQVEGEAS